jgi:hypothetical protein
MKKVALAILACFSMGMTMDAVALEDYLGFSLGAVKSSDNGVDYSSAAFSSILSARPNKYYGWEVQGGLLGQIGPYSVTGEADFCIAGFLPLGKSGINLYGKAGVDALFSSGKIFNTDLTYGAGVEYQDGKSILRLGYQHFNVGDSPEISAELFAITMMLKLD